MSSQNIENKSNLDNYNRCKKMFFVQTSRKITPEVPLPKQNNFIKNGPNIIDHLKILILFQMCLGVNRQYLLCERKCVLICSYIYTVVLVLSSVAFFIFEDICNVSHIVIKNFAAPEYIMLCLNALTFNRNKLKTFFTELELFDHKLNIKNNVFETTSKRFILIPLTAALLYHVLYLVLVNYHMEIPNTFYVLYLPLIVHDCEIITYSTFLVLIWKRIQILKAHAAKIFVLDDAVYKNSKQLSKPEELARNTNLDITSFHNVYDLLHKSAVNLNSIMSLPMMVILIKSGLSTIVLLKNLIEMIEGDSSDPLNYGFILTSTTAVVTIRCLMYSIFITYPCYIATITKEEVLDIRTLIHDFLNTEKYDKAERRKIKALFQLSSENEFTYALGGIVSLDMTLPLSFTSLCTTYLIIVLQFSKFIE